MIELDPIVIEFLAKNIFTINVALFIVKGLAKITPWAKDDQILQIFSGAVDLYKNRKIEEKKP